MTKIALFQFTGSEDKQANIDKATYFIREAARNGAKIICPHELFNTIYFCYEWNKKYFDLAEPIPGQLPMPWPKWPAKKLSFLFARFTRKR